MGLNGNTYPLKQRQKGPFKGKTCIRLNGKQYLSRIRLNGKRYLLMKPLSNINTASAIQHCFERQTTMEWNR